VTGLPARFGFPLAIDRRTGTLYCFPMESDEYRMPPDGHFRVYCSRDRGDSWEPLSTLPNPAPLYAGVLRSALTLDQLDPCGIYVGTTGGTIHLSRDAGQHWTTHPAVLPRILTLVTAVED
jgi:hypothetical protein